MSYKSQFYSGQGSPVFLLFGSWILVLQLHVWVKSIFFNLTRQSWLTLNVWIKAIYDAYLPVPHYFIKMFHLQPSQSILRPQFVDNLFIVRRVHTLIQR